MLLDCFGIWIIWIQINYSTRSLGQLLKCREEKQHFNLFLECLSPKKISLNTILKMLFWGILQILRQVKQQPHIWEGKGNEGMKDLCGVMLKNTEILNYHTALSRNWIEITFPSLLLSTFSHICNVSPLVLAELYEGCIFFFVSLFAFYKKIIKIPTCFKRCSVKGIQVPWKCILLIFFFHVNNQFHLSLRIWLDWITILCLVFSLHPCFPKELVWTLQVL